jgi:hypothetical protein
MKKLTFFLVLYISTFGLNAQNCKFDKNEIDAMTGEKIMITKRALLCEIATLGDMNTVDIKLKKVSSKTSEQAYIIAYLKPSAKHECSFKKGHKLIMKFDNDSIATMEGELDKTEYYIEPTMKNISLSGLLLDNEYKIGNRELELMRIHKIVLIRMYYSEKVTQNDVYFEFRKISKEISSLVNCITQ